MIFLSVIVVIVIGSLITVLTFIATQQRRQAQPQPIDRIALSRQMLPPGEQIELQRWTRDASLVLESLLRDEEMIPTLRDKRRLEIEDLVERYRDDD